MSRLGPTCYSPGQIIGVLDLRFLVLNKADLPVAVATTGWGRGRQKLKIILVLILNSSFFSSDKVGLLLVGPKISIFRQILQNSSQSA